MSVPLIRVSKSGVDVLSAAGTVPNNTLFDSQYNTFKILYQGTTVINVAGAPLPKYTFAHNSPAGTTTSLFVYTKFPDGRTVMTPFAENISSPSFDLARGVTNCYWDNTNVTMQFTSGTYTVNVAWMVFETPF